MQDHPTGRDAAPRSLDDSAFPALLGSVVACLALLVATSMTDETSLDAAPPASLQEISIAAATLTP